VRGLLVIVHRWAGLFIAIFLFIAGLTGALISWDHELDEWLNPDLFEAQQSGTPLPPVELVKRFEASNPKARVLYFPLSYEPGKTADLFVGPRVDPATGKLFPLDYNQAYLEPATGEVRGTRFWGQISLHRHDILPFLYKLHYSMHVPTMFGTDRLGIWLMGIVAVVWTFDCFAGLALTLPRRQRAGVALVSGLPARADKSWFARWAPAWRIKTNASAYRLNFDLHRAGGLWAWVFLLIVAFTSISMNLGDEVVRPMLGKVFSLTPEVSDSREQAPFDKPIEAKLPFSSILQRASGEAVNRSWEEPLGSTFYDQQTGIYMVSFFAPGGDHGSGGMGTKTLYLDGNTGAVLGDSVPWAGTAADVFMQLQFPLHSGRIAGLPGRILLSILGVVVAGLSLTGIIIWFKKRLARRKAMAGPAAAAPPARSFALLGALARSIGDLCDEERLRERVARSGERAHALSRPSRSLDLWGIGALVWAAVVIGVSAIFVGIGRVLIGGKGMLVIVSASLRDFGSLLSSRGFWRAAQGDAQFYLRRIRHAFFKKEGLKQD
jgi:uncharacterized iron-regulated membrane protein